MNMDYKNRGYSKPNYASRNQSQTTNDSVWAPVVKEHDGLAMKQYAYNKVFVQSDGEYLESADGAEIKIYSKDNGVKYIMVNGKPVWLDLMVGSCFCHKPKDGKHYVIHHKDNDLANCDKNNLEWIEKDDGVQFIESRINPFA